MHWFREKFKSIVVYVIIGGVGFVFVFYGIFNPRATRGLHEGAVAGKVNGDSISLADFNRAYSQRVEMFRSMGDGTLTDEQLKQFRVKDMVFNELVRKKLMVQEAQRQGLVASNDEVMERIKEIPAFQKQGRFDLQQYKQVLEANHYTPSSFEVLMREDLSAQRWQTYFQDRVAVADAELRSEYENSENKRSLKYVYLTVDSGKKAMGIKDADAAKRLPEVHKHNDALAEKLIAAIGNGGNAESKAAAVLKGEGDLKLTDSGWVTRGAGYLPGIGEAKEVLADAFAPNSPIDGKAKKYSLPGGVLVAFLKGKQLPDTSAEAFEKKRADLIRSVISRKERELMDAWMKIITERAEIDRNPDVLDS